LAGSVGISLHHLVSEYAYISVEERSKPVVLIEPVNQPEEHIHRQCDRHVAAALVPKLSAARAFHPQHQQQENATSNQVHARRQACQQIQPQGA